MVCSTEEWDRFVRKSPHGHILQTTAWGQLKSAFDWRPETVCTAGKGALVLFRRLPLGLSLAYVPRGPLADWNQAADLGELVQVLDRLCRARNAICLKLEPDLPDSPTFAGTLGALGFQPSPQTIQPRRTIVVNLNGFETEILGRMKPKTRYNIGLATKKDVSARPAQSLDEVDAFAGLMQETGRRDHFGIHTPDYYRQAYQLFHAAGQCELFLAFYQRRLLAGVMAFVLGKRAWYFYGASSNAERNRMAPYLAQWEAIRWAKSRGALVYDLWGIPDENEGFLESDFEQRHDGLWGVYRFKRGWGGQVVRTVGAWDRVYSPIGYQIYLAYLTLRGSALG
jgi:lipid II:glycine glycyltransferase (peptidoglycan interpeptide bridge formation enzyme)